MGFTTVKFALFFLALLIVYYRLPGKGQRAVLLAGSWCFALADGWRSLLMLLTTTVTAWAAGYVMGENQSCLGGKKARAANRPWMAGWTILNLTVLVLWKLCQSETASRALAGGDMAFLTRGLPLGISFNTLQAMSYVLDVYQGKVEPEKNFLKLALFTGFFPQLVQGPISRYGQLGNQFGERRDYEKKQVSFGMQRMLWGSFKKLVIADRMAVAVTALKDPQYTGGAFFLLTLFYAVQIYADFTGGIDMALGAAQAFGVTLPENFIHPFFSKNIAEYWRRWHATLGGWMKEYVFYPVSVSAPVRRLSKAARKKWPGFGKRLPVYGATLVTWLATGLWHGVTPNFVVWGMLNCLVIVISQELTPLYRKFHSRFRWKEKGWYGGFEMVRMFLLMNLIRACDLFPNVGEYFRRLGSLFTGFSLSDFACLDQLGLTALDYGILLAGVAVMAAVSLVQVKQGSIREKLWRRPVLRLALGFGLFLTVLLMGWYGVGYEAGDFIYNQF